MSILTVKQIEQATPLTGNFSNCKLVEKQHGLPLSRGLRVHFAPETDTYFYITLLQVENGIISSDSMGLEYTYQGYSRLWEMLNEMNCNNWQQRQDEVIIFEQL